MSTAAIPTIPTIPTTPTTPSSNIAHLPHLPHTAHPLPLREHAFTLHCQGLRSPAISAELGVPERTIRAWIAAALAALKDDLQLSRKEQLLLAVERQHQLTASAWQQFEAEAAARSALLDAALGTLHTLLHAADTASNGTTSATRSARPLHLHLHLPASTPAPRYLSLVLQTNKETNRLLGLHTLARLQLLAPDTPDSLNIEPSPIFGADIPAESATAAESQYAAKTATAAEDGLAASLQPANPHCAITSPSLALGATPAIPAESATASGSPLPAGAARAFVGASGGRPRDDVGAERAERAAGRFRPKPVAGGDPSKVVGEGWIGSGVRSPAESATAPASPASPASPAFRPTTPAPAVHCRDTALPAKTATAAPTRRTPKPWMM